MPSEPNRRFLALDVEEVSLVDEPANLTPFLVLKALEANLMSDKQQPAAAPESATSVEVEQQVAAGDDAVTKALAHVDSIVDKVTKAVKGDATSNSEPTPPDVKPEPPSNAENDGNTVETEKGAGMSFRQMAMKAGMTGDALKTAMANFEKATGLKGDMKFSASAPVSKSQDANTSEGEKTEETPEEALTLAGFASAIQKAAAFTPTRIQQLSEAQEIIKLILAGVAPGQSPATSTPKVLSHPNPNTSSVLTKKSASEEQSDGGEVVQALKSLGDVIKGFGERLEAVEKARPTGNSDQPDETHSKETVQKSLWNGVL